MLTVFKLEKVWKTLMICFSFKDEEYLLIFFEDGKGVKVFTRMLGRRQRRYVTKFSNMANSVTNHPKMLR